MIWYLIIGMCLGAIAGAVVTHKPLLGALSLPLVFLSTALNGYGMTFSHPAVSYPYLWGFLITILSGFFGLAFDIMVIRKQIQQP